MLAVGSLFSGVEGFGLGFEAAGFEVRWQCEIDKDATSVLERHYPNVKRYRDVRDLAEKLARMAPPHVRDLAHELLVGEQRNLFTLLCGAILDGRRRAFRLRVSRSAGPYPVVLTPDAVVPFGGAWRILGYSETDKRDVLIRLDRIVSAEPVTAVAETVTRYVRAS